MRQACLATLALVALLAPGELHAGECDASNPDWLFCEDFEDGGLGWDAWYAESPFLQCIGCGNPARMRLEQDPTGAHEGSWSLHMPAEASAGYQGAALAFRSCDGEKRTNCTLIGYDELHFRAWVRLADDHQYVHHFMSIGGTRPDGFWEGDGNAGCRPNGYRHAGTTVDFKNQDGEHRLFFYTYYPEMNCSTSAASWCAAKQPDICNGCAEKDMPCGDVQECCYGNHFSADPRPVLPRGEWVCLEMMMRLNTPGDADGEMAFWVNGELGHRQQEMHWRDVPELQLNKIWVQHYIASGDSAHSNRIWWDNIIGSTQRIGCGSAPPPIHDAGMTPPPQAPDGGPDGSIAPSVTTPDAGPVSRSAPSTGADPGPDDPAGAANIGSALGGGCSTSPSATPMVAGLLLLLLLMTAAISRRRHRVRARRRDSSTRRRR